MSTTEQSRMSRRDFIKTIFMGVGGMIGAALGIPSFAYLLSPGAQSTEDEGQIDLGPLENYPIGLPTRFDFTRTRVNGWERTATNYGMYVVRTGDQDVRVFSDICTHLGCRITWHPNIENYVSPCHDGHFDMLGNVVSGPPPRPLDEYVTKIEAGSLYVNLPAYRRSS
ncbi:MAG TPA: ubiquinol-cytochrome c reductase iron-sulfur subunit [Anaerolineales bacterium]